MSRRPKNVFGEFKPSTKLEPLNFVKKEVPIISGLTYPDIQLQFQGQQQAGPLSGFTSVKLMKLP
jgi:hypothetical protein